VKLAFHFPESVATVEDSYRSASTVHGPQSTEKTIYLFQDAHTNESGQRNLAKALDTLLTNNKDMKFVFTEAGVEDNSLTFLREKAPLSIRKAASDLFLKKGLLHGAELLQLTSEHDFVLWGVEDMALYKKALSNYRDVVKIRPKLQDYLAKIRTTLSTLQPKVLNPVLDRLLSDYLKYHREQIALTDYFDGLTRVAEVQQITLSEYPHLSLLRDLKQIESTIDFAKANTEQGEVIKSLGVEDRDELAEMLKNTPGRVGVNGHTQKAFYSLLEEKIIAQSPEPRARRFAELEKYFEYLDLSRKLEAKQVLDELVQLESKVLSSLAQSDDEQAFIRSTQLLSLYEKLFNLTLTTDEYAEYKKLSQDFSIKELAGFLNKQIMSLGAYYERALFLEQGYDEAVQRSEEFYELTLKRDEAFVEKMLTKMSAEKQSEAALVVGGYHATNLKNLLKQKQISYVSVTPQILQETNQKKYESILLSQDLASGQAVLPALTATHSGRMLMALALKMTPYLGQLQVSLQVTESQGHTVPPSPGRNMSVAGARLAKEEPVVIGAGGFIGRQLVKYLSSLGETPSLSVRTKNNSAIPKPGTKVFVGELPDTKYIQDLVDNSNVIYHLGAVSTPADADEDPARSLATALGTARLVKAAKGKRIIRTSSELVGSVGVKAGTAKRPEEASKLLNFENGTEAARWLRKAQAAFNRRVDKFPNASKDSDIKFIESFLSDNPIPENMKKNVYALVYVLDEYFIAHSPNGISVRLSQVYGPEDFWSEARLSSLIRYFTGHDKTIYDLYENQPRRFIHVDDVVRILHGLAELKELPADRLINVGSPEEFTNEQLVRMLKKITNVDAHVNFTKAPAQIPLPQSQSRLESLLPAMGLSGFHWTPMERGIEETVRWYKTVSLRPLTLGDVRRSISDGEVKRLVDDLANDVDGIVPAAAVRSPGHMGDDLPVGNQSGVPTLLITGGAGFIGSNAVRYFLKAHPTYKIIILDNLTWAGPKEALVDIMGGPFASRVEVYKGDVNDASLVSALVERADAVIHYAAESNVDRSNIAAADFVHTNIEGTRVVAQAVQDENVSRTRKHKSKVRFVHISTDEVTGDSTQSEENAFTEESPYAATNKYAETKVEAEKIVRAMNDAIGSSLGAVIMRTTNVIGPNNGAPKTLGPVALAHIILGLPIPLYILHDGVERDKERDFLNVYDAARAVDVLIHEGKPGEIYNFAGHERRKLTSFILDVLSEAKGKVVTEKSARRDNLIAILNNNRPHNDAAYVLDDSKFTRAFPQFKHVIQYNEGIRSMVKWALNHKEALLEAIRTEAYEPYYRQLYKDYPETADLMKQRIEELAREVQAKRDAERQGQGARLADTGQQALDIDPMLLQRTLRLKKLLDQAQTALSDTTVVSRQMESGMHRGLLEGLEEEYNALITDLTAQTNLTGGLGALMHDLREAWTKLKISNISILPVYETFKGQNFAENLPLEVREGRKSLGDFLRGELTKQATQTWKGIALGKLDVGHDFEEHALGRAKAVVGKDLRMDVYETRTKLTGALTYEFDVYYMTEDGRKVHVFDEIYPDWEYGQKLWRDVHIGVYSLASQKITKMLQEKGIVKKDVIFIDNEVFVSMPTPMFPHAFHHHINHTVFRPGLYQPSALSYRMLGFPEYMRELIVRDGDINVVDAVSMFADIVTGVSLYEHTPVLASDILAAYVDKLTGYNDGDIRSTNGVYLDQWQTPEVSALILQFKQKIGIPSDADEKDFYDALRRPENRSHLDAFKDRSDFLHALYVAKFLEWMRDSQGNGLWLEQTWKKYVQRAGITDTDFGRTLHEFEEAIRQAMVDESRWPVLIAEFHAWNETIHEDPILSNVRRQVPYKGPDKWVEIFEGWFRDALLEIFREGDPASGLSPRDWTLRVLNDIYLDQNSNGHLDREALKTLMSQIRGASESDWLKPMDWGFHVIKRSIVDSPGMHWLRIRLGTHPKIVALHSQIGRVVIGGRVFDQMSIERFRWMNRITVTMGLQDRIAFIENYSINNARLLFRAMAAVVMLSDELLEAASTSPGKGLANFAMMIAIWGGFIPEIAEIVDSQGLEVSVFDENGDPAITYEEVIQNLGREDQDPKHWRLRNLLLVEYSPLSHEQSAQKGGKRRPSAQSLAKAVSAFNEIYRSPEKRRAARFEVMASSYKVDMVHGQALAHATLWTYMIAERARVSALMPTGISAEDTLTLVGKEKVFNWLRKPDPSAADTITAQPGEPGLFGFAQSARKLRVRGLDSYYSVAYHAHEDPSQIFEYILDHLLVDVSEAFDPLRREIERLRDEAAVADRVQLKVSLNLKAVALIDQLSTRIAWEILHQISTSAHTESHEVLRRALNRREVRNDLLRYLDRHAEPLDSSDSNIKHYLAEMDGKKVLVAVNLKSLERGIASSVLSPSGVQTLIGERLMDNPTKVFVTSSLVNNIKEQRNDASQINRKGIDVEILPDINMQVLEVRAVQESQLVLNLSAAIKGDFVDGKDPVVLIREKLDALRDKPDELFRWLEPVSLLGAGEARLKFESIPAIMAFVATLAPRLLDNMKAWDPLVYERLKTIVATSDTAHVFEKGRIRSIRTNKASAIVFSRTVDGAQGQPARSIEVILHFARPSIVYEGKVSVHLNNSDLGHILKSVSSDPFRVKDHYFLVNGEGAVYPSVHQKKEFEESGWDVAVPVVPGETDNNGLVQEGQRFQILELVTASSGARLATKHRTRWVPDPKSAIYDAVTRNDMPALQDLVKKANRSGLVYLAFVGALGELLQTDDAFVKVYERNHKTILQKIDTGRLVQARLFPAANDVPKVMGDSHIFVDDTRRPESEERAEAFQVARRLLSLSDVFLKETLSRELQSPELADKILGELKKNRRFFDNVKTSLAKEQPMRETANARVLKNLKPLVGFVRVVRFHHGSAQDVYDVMIPYGNKLVSFALHASFPNKAAHNDIKRKFTLLSGQSRAGALAPTVLRVYQPYDEGRYDGERNRFAYSSQYLDLHPAIRFDGKNFYLDAVHLKDRSATFIDVESTRNISAAVSELITLFYDLQHRQLTADFNLGRGDLTLNRLAVSRRGKNRMTAKISTTDIANYTLVSMRGRNKEESSLEFLGSLLHLSYLGEKASSISMSPEHEEALVVGTLEGFLRGMVRKYQATANKNKKDESMEQQAFRLEQAALSTAKNMLHDAFNLTSTRVFKPLPIFTQARIEDFIRTQIDPRLTAEVQEQTDSPEEIPSKGLVAWQARGLEGEYANQYKAGDLVGVLTSYKGIGITGTGSFSTDDGKEWWLGEVVSLDPSGKRMNIRALNGVTLQPVDNVALLPAQVSDESVGLINKARLKELSRARDLPDTDGARLSIVEKRRPSSREIAIVLSRLSEIYSYLEALPDPLSYVAASAAHLEDWAKDENNADTPGFVHVASTFITKNILHQLEMADGTQEVSTKIAAIVDMLNKLDQEWSDRYEMTMDDLDRHGIKKLFSLPNTDGSSGTHTEEVLTELRTHQPKEWGAFTGHIASFVSSNQTDALYVEPHVTLERLLDFISSGFNEADVAIVKNGATADIRLAGARLADEIVDVDKKGEFIPSGKPILLLVDDEAVIRTLVTRVIGRREALPGDAGLQIVLAQTLEEAKRAFEIAQQSGLLRLVITDNNYPESTPAIPGVLASHPRSGEELYRLAKQENIPVIFMSGREKPEGVDNSDFISKPFRFDALIQKIKPYTGARLAEGVTIHGKSLAAQLFLRMVDFVRRWNSPSEHEAAKADPEVFRARSADDRRKYVLTWLTQHPRYANQPFGLSDLVDDKDLVLFPVELRRQNVDGPLEGSRKYQALSYIISIARGAAAYLEIRDGGYRVTDKARKEFGGLSLDELFSQTHYVVENPVQASDLRPVESGQRMTRDERMLHVVRWIRTQDRYRDGFTARDLNYDVRDGRLTIYSLSYPHNALTSQGSYHPAIQQIMQDAYAARFLNERPQYSSGQKFTLSSRVRQAGARLAETETRGKREEGRGEQASEITALPSSVSLLPSSKVAAAMVLCLFIGVSTAHAVELRTPQELPLMMGDAGTKATLFTLSAPGKGEVVVTEGGYTVYQNTTGREKKIAAALDRIIAQNISQNVFVKIQASFVQSDESLARFVVEALSEAARTKESSIRYGFIGTQSELNAIGARLSKLDEAMGGKLFGENGIFDLLGRDPENYKVVNLLAPGSFDPNKDQRYAFLNATEGQRLAFNLRLARATGQLEISESDPLDQEYIRATELATGNRSIDRAQLRNIIQGQILDPIIQKLYAWLPDARAVNISQAVSAISSRLAAILQAA
jgi:dTDP-glucose 4,6-dehydratase